MISAVHQFPAASTSESTARIASLLIISPCRDEAEYCRHTLESMLAQTVRPARWIIVDDGSTDGTSEILAEYSRRYDWITVIRREDRGRRAVGPGVVDAFYAGLAAANLGDFEFLCKLDLDLELPPRYFELLIGRMKGDPLLGTCSGKPYFRDPATGELQSERIGDEMSAGMTKFYRTRCFEAIGGFVRQVCWDGIDCHKCRMNGWMARSWDDPDLRFVHLRQMGSSHRGIWTGRKRWGGGKWFMGSSLAYVFAASVFRMMERPLVIGGAGILVGYLGAMIRGVPRFDDRACRRYIRRFEHCGLLLGKRRALELYEERIRKGLVAIPSEVQRC